MSRVALGLVRTAYSDDVELDVKAVDVFIGDRGWRYPPCRWLRPTVSILLIGPNDSAYSQLLLVHNDSEAIAIVVPTMTHLIGIEAIAQSRADIYSLDGHHQPRRPYRELLGLDP
ncbi:hypothetical protein HLB23_31540 [Nocardia uniformis]|uniref:Uncharacterized protein n=1 Tax=Nocardia uniformis TaxID=53432 RepID=A0A849C6U3_9NOCA|nr:hypothetical protein [Nocardia uniformis]NNH74332.1 hypothetical protein [Nocardia uniformis]